MASSNGLNGKKTANANGRDEKGRFTKGGRPGPGRPPLAAELPMIEGLHAAISAEKIAQALEALHQFGVAGDSRALSVWLAYALGKPQQFVDVTSGGEKLNGPTVYLPEVSDEP